MITISLCMIVKDEEKNLERCLQSVKDVPDEIIIVDTGSTDGTKSVAKKWTRNVMDFEWVNDFSKARNYSFKHATMDYILWLDADDILLPEDLQKLLELKKTLNPSVDVVSMIYHTLFDENNNVITSIRRHRLVKRRSNFTWHGIVHEDLTTSKLDFRSYNSNIVVTHKKETSGSTDRNLKIYEEHKGLDMTPHDVFHYARELHAHEKYHKAIKQYERFLKFEDIKVNQRLFILHKLASCYHMIGDLEKEWEITLHSFEYDIPRPEFSCRMGEHFLNKNQYREAAFWYEIAVKGESDDPWSIEQKPFKTWLPHKQLGLCYFQLQDYETSLKHNKIVLTYLPNDMGTQTNIAFLKEKIKKE